MRDFRDAKAMAHALRSGLHAKAIETTHSECLELIAKVFGYDNWNILAAKIEAAAPGAPTAPPLAPAAALDAAPPKPTLHCSFCGKSQHDVRALVSGPASLICDECVAICNDIIEDRDIWELLKADESGGGHAGVSTDAHLRGLAIEQLTACRDRSQRGVERSRLELHRIQRALAIQDGEAAAADEQASPGFSQLRSKPKEELLRSKDGYERTLILYEKMLRMATTALNERRS
jgi:hypothetical protein